jgi:hypothetical protein
MTRPPLRLHSLRPLLLWLLLFACAPLCTGCPQRFARPDDAFDAPASVIDQVMQRSASLTSLRIQTKSDYWDNAEGKRVVGRPVTLLTSSPSSLRIQIGSGFGSTLGALASNGALMTMLDLHNNVFYSGPPTLENISLLLPLYLSGEDFIRILSGGFPTANLSPTASSSATLTWDDTTGYYQLSIPLPNAQIQRVSLTHPDLAVSEIRILSSSDDTLYLYQAKDFSPYEGVPLPAKARFELPARELDVQLRIEKTEVNVDLPDALFLISAPDGVEHIRLSP